MGKAIFFVKTTFIDLNLVKAVEAVEDGQKSPFFKYLSIIFFYKLFSFKDSSNTTLYLLDFIGF